MAVNFINVNKVFVRGDETITALEQTSFQVNSHEFVCVVGPSGCGKTTILKILAGLIEPSNGAIEFGAVPANNRPRTALVFQEQGLYPWMTAMQNDTFGLEIQGMAKRERNRKAQVFFDRFGLGGFEDAFPHELSGGMRQRVAFARAFLSDPQILLMDEPFGALDAQTKELMQEELLQIWKEDKKTVIYVTHDIEEAIIMGDRILVMSGRPGRIMEDIPVPFERPRVLEELTSDPKVYELKKYIWQMLKDEARKSIVVR